ncbi:hypothetical protein [Arthrospiribacter ruber]|nr:hypothetical protein [Arthrospiribacter ruber]
MERDTVYFEEFLGREKFQYFIDEDSSLVKSGSYAFTSELYNQLLSNELTQLEIDGKYSNNRFEGVWEYKLFELEVELLKIRDGRTVVLENNLDGIERTARLNYKQGKPEGAWKIENIIITSNRKSQETTGGTINFKEGTAIGNFSFDDPKDRNFVRGTLNEEGFLEGELTIRFVRDGDEIKEVRTFKDGFLLKLSKFNETEGKLEAEIFYKDVQSQLEDADGRIEDINFTISEEGFGIGFQNGYNLGDEKLTEQEEGNEKINIILNRYKRFATGLVNERDEPQFNLTRRFKFVYPEEEEDIIRDVQPRLNIMLEEFNDFLSNPQFILNRDRIDSLPYVFGFIDHSRKRVQDMLEVIEQMEDGFFDFLYRPNFYPNGLTGLNQPSTFTYEENGKEEEAEYDLGVYVDSGFDLISQIAEVTEVLRERTNELLDFSFMEIRIFDEQATIDSLDSDIVQLKTRADALYSFLQEIPADRTFEEMPLDYRVYRVIHNNTLVRLQDEYLDAEDYEEKVAKGEELTCMLQYLIDQHDEILYIEEMPERLDKTFTRFSPNPFFERDIETKILPNIYGKGTGPLFQSYAENLFESSSCKSLQSNLEKFRKLEDRLKELAKRSDSEEVVRLDRALRRENIPNRIERLLNL